MDTFPSNMQLSATWGDLATYCLPSCMPILQKKEKHDPDDYVDVFPLSTRPDCVLHDSSMVSRILEGFTTYIRDHDLAETPLQPEILMSIEGIISGRETAEWDWYTPLRTYFACNITPLLSSLFRQAKNEAKPPLPVKAVWFQTSEMLHGGCNLEAIGEGLHLLSDIAVTFEWTNVLDNHLEDMLKVRRLEKGSLSNGSAIIMKMAAHSLHLSKGSLHKRFGVLYSADRLIISELCRRPDGSLAIILSDCHNIGHGHASQIPFIAVLAFLLLPGSVEYIRMPSGDVLSQPLPMLPSPEGAMEPQYEFPKLLKDRLSGNSTHILLSFAHPRVSSEPRVISPCSFIQSTDDSTPSLPPSPSTNSSSDGQSSDSFLWDFHSLNVYPVLKEHVSRSTSDTLNAVLLTEPLRHEYDMTWRGTATFGDRSVRPIVVKMAYKKLDFTSLAREAQIYERLAEHNTVVAPTYYGSYVIEDRRLDISKGYIAAMIILEDAGAQLKGFDGWEPLSLKDLKIKQINDISRRLEGLHTAGFKHNDFASRNVLVNEAGEIRLIDFGRSERHECPGRKTCEELRRQRETFRKIRPKFTKKALLRRKAAADKAEPIIDVPQLQGVDRVEDQEKVPGVSIV